MNSRHQRDRVAQWMLLQRMVGIGTHRAHRLCERYGTAEKIFSLTPSMFSGDDFFTPQERATILSPDFVEIQAEIEQAEQRGITILTPDSPEYPEQLRNIHSMPLVLYSIGDLSLLNGHYLISVVGSRRPNEYGRVAAKKLSGEIALLGGVVVSGLALGTDADCHWAALEAQGKTIAFVAAGLDIDYPRTNNLLRKRIEKLGLVLGEYPLGTPALGSNFPVRNRLISGVSMATVIVQCTMRSGTMLTAGHALTQGRDLFAVPDSILSEMDGCNNLLLQGAEPALSGRQILQRYPEIYGYPLHPVHPVSQPAGEGRRPVRPVTEPLRAAKLEPPAYLSSDQARVYAQLIESPRPFDLLCEHCCLSANAMLSILTQLELFGLARLLPGRVVEAIRRV